ncbi:MAG TPA: HEAT repeat domain-containing protein [Terriglobales bacterium]
MEFEKFVLVCLNDSNSKVVCDAMNVLEEMKSQEAKSRIELLTKSADPVICGAALAYFLKLGQGTYLREAVEYLDKQPQNMENDSVRIDILMNIGRVNDPKSLPILHGLLSSARVELRRVAATVIRNCESQDSVPFLIRALDDTDEGVRWICLGTLDTILGPRETEDAGEVVNTPQNHGAVVKAWKTWWQSEDAAKYKVAQTPQ